jgi:tetratricopeptide (TPR) repeat protein
VRLAHLEPGQHWNSAVSTDKASEAETAADPAGKAPEVQADTPELPAAVRAEKLVPSPGVKIGRPETRGRQSAHGAARVAMVATPARGTVESPGAARAALAAGDAPRALEIYRNLTQKSGPVAENAAYEIGRILNERGQSSAAVAAWRRYRSDYPNGILRVEADVSIIETLARAGETDDALTEATDFLRRRPDSERRGEIARVAGDLYRARGDCRHAIGAYQVALSASRARDITEAAGFHRAACLVRDGGNSGVDALRSYLRSYPDGRFRRQATELIEQATSKTVAR